MHHHSLRTIFRGITWAASFMLAAHLFAELPDLPIESGPFEPTWDSIQKNYANMVNPEEGGIPKDIKTDQPWIAETPVGDWYYGSGFTYDSGMVTRYLLEEVARDGNVSICISPRPDGSLDEGSIRMLREAGEWMRRNGEGIYGSRVWVKLGEGEVIGGQLKVHPGGKLGKKQADFQFGPQNFRFTVGKNGAPLSWEQQADASAITCPNTTTFSCAVGFKIE